MSLRLKARDAQGMPSDPLVLRTAVSYRACQTLQSLPIASAELAGTRLLLLQPPPPGAPEELAQRLGDEWVAGTLIYNSLEGTLGPRLILGSGVEVKWIHHLQTAAAEAFVLADGGAFLRPWGRTPQALLYLCATEVARGQYHRARSHLRRAALLSGESIPFLFNPDQMIVSTTAVQNGADAFMEFLTDGLPPEELSEEAIALRAIFSELLAILADDTNPVHPGSKG
jgi:hypothetical protein